MGEFHENLVSASKQTLQIKRPEKSDRKTIVKKIYLSQGDVKTEPVEVKMMPSSVSASRPHTGKNANA